MFPYLKRYILLIEEYNYSILMNKNINIEMRSGINAISGMCKNCLWSVRIMLEND